VGAAQARGRQEFSVNADGAGWASSQFRPLSVCPLPAGPGYERPQGGKRWKAGIIENLLA